MVGFRIVIPRLVAGICFCALVAWSQNGLILRQEPVAAQTMAGHVYAEHTDLGMEGVLVEVCDSNWRNPASFQRTDAEGYFSFPPLKKRRIYYLRLSRPNFNTLLVKVKLRPAAPRELKVYLQPAT